MSEPYSGVIQYESGLDLTDKYLEAIKKIDPSLRSVKIIMKGDFNRDISKSYPRQEKKK